MLSRKSYLTASYHLCNPFTILPFKLAPSSLPKLYNFKINVANCINSTGKRSENDTMAMQAILMEQKLEEKMQCFLSNGIQYHQAILR
jgi:hypothetical protein